MRIAHTLRPCRRKGPFPIPATAIQHAILAVFMALLALPAAAQDWSGRWQTMFREGQVVMDLTQTGDRVQGTYRPGDGRIEGTVNGTRLDGRWIEANASGALLFVMSRDGQTFTGRYDTGEYWNGFRTRPSQRPVVPFADASTPVGALKTIITALNASRDGRTEAALIWEPLLIHDGPPTTAPERRQRRNALQQLIDMSTFHLAWADAYRQGDRVLMPIGPVDTDWRFDLELRLGEDGIWRMVVPEAPVLARLEAEALAALGQPSYDAYQGAREAGPRQTMRAFIEGIHTWHRGGEARVRAAMDLSWLPPHLAPIEGEILADYLLQVIDRAGYVIWQEIPDDPDQRQPYVHFDHPVARVVIERREGPDGEPLWQFSAATLRGLPALYEAMQDLPVAEGLVPTRPFSRYFRLRQAVLDTSPVLAERWFLLENWQWIAGTLALAVIGALGWAIGPVLRLFARASGLAGTGGFLWPLRLALSGAALDAAVKMLGLRADLGALLGGLGLLLQIAGVAGILFRLTDRVLPPVIEAARRQGVGDEIIASLIIGVCKVAIVLAAMVIGAHVLGLPYEGVVAGLGVGGLALAFAGRETVSNILSAAILLADRPFRKGDLIEFSGTLANVQEVGLRSTRLRTMDDSELIVPNSKLADDTVNNWGRRRNRRLILQIGLTYDTPRATLDAFVDRLRLVYIQHPDSEPTYYVGLKGFGPSSIDIELWGYFRTPGYEAFVAAQHRLLGDIVDLAAEMEVSFAFPTRTVHIAGPIPADRPAIAPSGAPSGAAEDTTTPHAMPPASS